MLRDIDGASLQLAVRFKPCAVQVLGHLLAKVTSFGPRELCWVRVLIHDGLDLNPSCKRV
jgi:hypothetical protein